MVPIKNKIIKFFLEKFFSIQNSTKWKRITCYFKENFLWDFIFLGAALIISILRRQDLIFIYESNKGPIILIIPIIFVFIWLGLRGFFERNILLQTASIFLVAFIFLISVAYEDANKIKNIVAANDHNCIVASGILSLKDNKDLSDQFSLNYFFIQPYIDNTSFIFERSGTTAATMMLSIAYSMQSANSLIATVQNLNVQGANPLFGSFIAEPLRGYNSDLLKIAQKVIDNICNVK